MARYGRGVAQPFEYVAWIEAPSLPIDDQDREWCAVFIVLADSSTKAVTWGDVLTRAYCVAVNEVFLHSSVEPHICGEPALNGEAHRCPNYAGSPIPALLDGVFAADDFIGW
jgi:hypothetical protein